MSNATIIACLLFAGVFCLVIDIYWLRYELGMCRRVMKRQDEAITHASRAFDLIREDIGSERVNRILKGATTDE